MPSNRTKLSVLKAKLLFGGISSEDTASKSRAIKISNLILLSAIGNTFGFGLLFLYLNDWPLFKLCLGFNIIYIGCYLLNILGLPQLGRPLSFISGNLIIFYSSAIFRGEAGIELIFFSLAVMPFLFFGWEERRWYLLSIISVVLYLLGEYRDWIFFNELSHNYNTKYINLFSIIATVHQLIGGTYYYLKQSLGFEKESRSNLERLELEYKKNIHAHKMLSLGQMANGVAHEVNSPLMVISGNIELLRRNQENIITIQDKKNLEIIEKMVTRISTVVKALLNFSKSRDSQDIQNTSLTRIIESTVLLSETKFQLSGVTLNISCVEDIIIPCRPTEISQVIFNLLNNALESVQSVQTPVVTISVKRSSNYAAISIEDNGRGIPSAIMDRIWDPFFSTKDVGSGLGMGLSISKGLIESHQGQLNYFSQNGKTVFEVKLPLFDS